MRFIMSSSAVLDHSDQEITMQLLMYLLPPCNSDTLQRLLEFLATVAAHAEDSQDRDGLEVRAGTSRIWQSRTGQDRTGGQNRARQGRTEGQDKARQEDRTGQDRAGQDRNAGWDISSLIKWLKFTVLFSLRLESTFMDECCSSTSNVGYLISMTRS